VFQEPPRPYGDMSSLGTPGYQLNSTDTCPALPTYYGDQPGSVFPAILPTSEPATTGNASTLPPLVLVRPPFPGLRNSHRYATPAPLPLQRPRRSSSATSPSLDLAAERAALSSGPVPGSQIRASDFAQTSGTRFITEAGDFYFAGKAC
jgi:hypothetical protein